MTADLVVSGSHAIAHRYEAIPDSRVIDAWLLHPRGEAADHIDMLCVRIEHTWALVLLTAGQGVDDAHLCEPIPVAEAADARTVAEQLARRHVIAGKLPLPPAGDDDRAAWRAVITALAATLHSAALAPT